jgi:LysR family transcriptional regulator, regulator for bpeEF and oprC
MDASEVNERMPAQHEPPAPFRAAAPRSPSEQSGPHGTLRVAFPTSLGRQYVVPALSRFAVQYPALKVLAIFADGEVSLDEVRADAALRIGQVTEPSVASHLVSEASVVTCASPDYLARNGTPRTPAELAQHECLGLFALEHGAMTDWIFKKGSERITFRPNGCITMTDSDPLVDAAVSGAGIVTVLDIFARRAIASGALHPILADWQSEHRVPISVVYPREQASAKVRAFADFVTRLFPRPRYLLR